jgi:peptide/nickel transport system ATP-binding protein
MTETILDVQNLKVNFASDPTVVTAVNQISFSLKRGQTLGIVGESGSGKSVTSFAIMGLIPTPGKIAEGDIWFHQNGTAPVNLVKLPERDKQKYRGGKISMIFQEPMSSLNPVFTCGFQLMEALQLHQNLSQTEAVRQAIALLQEVKLIPSDPILQEQLLQEADARGIVLTETELWSQIHERKRSFLNRYPHELSGGQIQRVMIAMAISCNPAILIADEPTTALDVTVQATILELLRELQQKRGMSIIFVTHDLSIIAQIADEVAVMYRGKIVESGPVAQIFYQPQHPYTKGLLACRPQMDRRLVTLPTVSDFMESHQTATGDWEILQKNPSETIFLEVEPNDLQQRASQLSQQKVLLSVENLQVFFPVRGVLGRTQRYVPAVNSVSFEIYPGETLGLVGESGCGKTTLGRTLVRLLKPTGGRICFEDRDITHLRGKGLRQLRQDLQIIFQDPYGSLNPRMKVGALVTEPMKIFAKTKGIKAQESRDRAANLLERVGLKADDIYRYPHEFSGGQRQRICIARALALNPRFIVCDESVSALDVSVQAQVLNLLKTLQSEFDLTYLFISHDLSVVKFMSDRIMVMNQGKIEEIGPAETIYQSPQRDYTKQLIAAIPQGMPSAAA